MQCDKCVPYPQHYNDLNSEFRLKKEVITSRGEKQGGNGPIDQRAMLRDFCEIRQTSVTSFIQCSCDSLTSEPFLKEVRENCDLHHHHHLFEAMNCYANVILSVAGGQHISPCTFSDAGNELNCMLSEGEDT